MKIRTNVISYNIRKYERVNIFTGTKTVEIKIHRGGKSPTRTKFSRVQRTFTQSKSSSIGWQKSLGVGDVCYARWVVGKRGCALSLAPIKGLLHVSRAPWQTAARKFEAEPRFLNELFLYVKWPREDLASTFRPAFPLEFSTVSTL